MDKEFFVQAIEQSGPALFRIAYTLLRNTDDCRDALQETALKAWEKRRTLRSEDRFFAWAARILVNECRNIQRKRSRALPLDWAPEPAAPPPDISLAVILQSLPEKYRLPLVMQVSEGMSYQEIARALGLSEPTVRGRIHRAKEQLRKELEAK